MAKTKLITKTWKLGEICQGGVVTIEIKDNIVAIIAKEWDYSTGSRKSSDQSNAKEFNRLEVETNEFDAERKISNFLHELMHSWAAEEIDKWIHTKQHFTSFGRW